MVASGVEAGLSLDDPKSGLVWLAFRKFSRIVFDAPFSTLRFATRVEADPNRDVYTVTMDRLFADQPLEVFARQPLLGLSYTIGYRMVFEADDDLLVHSEFRTSHSMPHDRDFFAGVEKMAVFPVAFGDKKPIRVEITSWGSAERKKIQA